MRPADPRLRTLLAVVFACCSTLAAADLLLGFVFADLTGATLEVAGPLAGGTLLLAGASVAVVQLALARFPVSPRTLVVAGPPFTGVAFLAVAVATTSWQLVLAGCVAGVGLGLAMTGWASGASLAVEDHEQGQAAGQVQVVTSLAYMTGPIVGGAAYGVWPALPWLLLVPPLFLVSAAAAFSQGIRAVQRRHRGQRAIGSGSSP